MKAQGYRAKLLWEKSPEPGWMRMAASVIWKSSLNIVVADPAIKEVLEDLG
jgi:hypothetical protein